MNDLLYFIGDPGPLFIFLALTGLELGIESAVGITGVEGITVATALVRVGVPFSSIVKLRIHGNRRSSNVAHLLPSRSILHRPTEDDTFFRLYIST
ncbi:ATPase subunit 6 [Olea europaea subsp. europaea]|uniref:ATPase subunit 6, partial (Mitochondrion) n=1 Tax=Olea europaea subsp. europaea TaxID=158383 RepID=A0A8S0R415_OLEEU|nr:ATPase subunit 6 [Olea europaea subsp. europaea]